MRQLLHVGCGSSTIKDLPVYFASGWREFRLDINDEVNPDIVASIVDMPIVADAAFDAVFSSHNIEHLYPHEVPLAFLEFRRVLKADGFLLVKCPDLGAVARAIAKDGLDAPLYTSPSGVISPLDVLYGYRPSLRAGNLFMAHRTGFDAKLLSDCALSAGFSRVLVVEDNVYGLHALCFCADVDQDVAQEMMGNCV